MIIKLYKNTSKNKNKIKEKSAEEKRKGINKGGRFGAKNRNINDD